MLEVTDANVDEANALMDEMWAEIHSNVDGTEDPQLGYHILAQVAALSAKKTEAQRARESEADFVEYCATLTNTPPSEMESQEKLCIAIMGASDPLLVLSEVEEMSGSLSLGDDWLRGEGYIYLYVLRQSV